MLFFLRLMKSVPLSNTYLFFLCKVCDKMSTMEKPVRITLGSQIGKKWTKVVGFLCLWVQEEIGHSLYKMINKRNVLAATLAEGGLLQIKIDEDSPKFISSRLHKCLLKYSNMRAWRLPKNNIFFINVSGNEFLPTDHCRYIPE